MQRQYRKTRVLGAGDVMGVEINPLVAEAHKLKEQLDLQQNIFTAHNDYARATRTRNVLYRAIQRFHRRLDKFEYRSNETIIA